MVSIEKSVSKILSIPKCKMGLALQGAKLGLKFGAKAFSAPLAGSLTTLYLQYIIAKSAFTVVSGYAGQYHELEGGYKKVGFTPKEIGAFFKELETSKNSWNILNYRFDRENILDVQNVLLEVYKSVKEPEIMQVMAAQILTKVLVNKNAEFLQVGQKIKVPVIDSEGERQLVTYELDQKFDLWNGVPAYGFKDTLDLNPPLLIFRATNTILEEKDTLPTLVANLHPKGPAWKLFSNSEKEIQKWLEDQKKGNLAKARLMGYSQGGVLGSYFLTYHSEYFSDAENYASYIFDAPGVSHTIARDWHQIERKPAVNVFVNRGDLIPKIGDCFIGRAYEVRIAQNLKGFKSHQALSLFAPQWKIVEIGVPEEKKSKSRGILSTMQKVAGAMIYRPAKAILLPCAQSMRS